MRQLISLFFVLISYSFTSVNDDGKKMLYLEVEGINKLEGNIGILVFASKEGFPRKAEKAIMELEVKVTSNKMKIPLKDLPYGDYAFSVMQDVNSNKEMDVNLIGIPKEPYGFSNNPSIFFGIPNFKDVVVNFSDRNQLTTVKLINL
ncbi:MAG: DUF2141 domain-containing protein [Vicingaceae bacterium]